MDYLQKAIRIISIFEAALGKPLYASLETDVAGEGNGLFDD